MKHILLLLTALLQAPPATLLAADAPVAVSDTPKGDSKLPAPPLLPERVDVLGELSPCR